MIPWPRIPSGLSVQLLLAEHGFGSDTYDFTYVCVLVHDDGTIWTTLWGGRAAAFVAQMFWPVKSGRYYGHSYEALHDMMMDINIHHKVSPEE